MGHKNLVLTDSSSHYPAYLKKASSNRPITSVREPVLINTSTNEGQKKLEKIVRDNPPISIVDNYAEQYAELLLSQNAHLYRANYDQQVSSIAELLDKHYGKTPPWQLGTWVYFPWTNQIVHVLGQHDYEMLRTIRNRDLITEKEQALLQDFNTIVFGASVGSAAAQALGISGISRKIKLVDGAVISGSNLNRILTGVSSVGLGKTTVIGRQIYEMNPYSTVQYYDKTNASNVESMLDKPWEVNAVIDEIDDIEMKIKIRFEARKRKIPVLMATELGDTIMLDVERFDLEPERQLFHGLIPGVEDLINNPPKNYREWTKNAVKIIDPTNMPLKMQRSVLKIGTTIVTHPQLGSTVMMTGGVIAFAVKNIALGNDLRSGRYVVSLENELLASHKSRKHKREHRKHTKVLVKSVSSL